MGGERSGVESYGRIGDTQNYVLAGASAVSGEALVAQRVTDCKPTSRSRVRPSLSSQFWILNALSQSLGRKVVVWASLVRFLNINRGWERALKG